MQSIDQKEEKTVQHMLSISPNLNDQLLESPQANKIATSSERSF